VLKNVAKGSATKRYVCDIQGMQGIHSSCNNQMLPNLGRIAVRSKEQRGINFWPVESSILEKEKWHWLNSGFFFVSVFFFYFFNSFGSGQLTPLPPFLSRVLSSHKMVWW